MKTNQRLTWTASLLLGFAAMTIRAEDSAVVKDNRVNVRGQASMSGEVVTQLRQGETVVVLEEITVAKPKAGEPAKWLRIQMPTNTPVWVSAAFIDGTNKTVSVTRLNVRAGPGENFSVVGRLEKGAVVKDIRTVENWLEIETPTNAYGFVAAEFLTKYEPASVPPVAVEKVQPQAQAPANPPLATVPTATPPPAKPESVAAPVEQPPVVAPPVATLPSVAAPVPPPKEEPPPKRIVSREGIVRRTASIQAPTYFELQNRDTGKIINYLHTGKIDLKLDALKGRKILVTGEEAIDERWPNVPVIEVETLRLVP